MRVNLPMSLKSFTRNRNTVFAVGGMSFMEDLVLDSIKLILSPDHVFDIQVMSRVVFVAIYMYTVQGKQ